MKKREEGEPLIIATNGKMTLVFSEGKVYGDGIKELQFSHEAPALPVVEAIVDSLFKPMEINREMFEQYLEHIMNGE